jgi:predicted kinase
MADTLHFTLPQERLHPAFSVLDLGLASRRHASGRDESGEETEKVAFDSYETEAMKKTLVIFSGLPGTGKTALAHLVAHKLRIPLLSIDDVVAAIPHHMSRHADPFWEDMICILLSLVEYQLEQGFSVVVDSVFMGEDRYQAHEIAGRHEAAFRPICTYLSDEKVWEERVRQRVERAPLGIRDKIATWERIQEQRKHFQPWKPGSALFVDGVNPVETNLEKVLGYITAAKVALEPLRADR